MIEKPGPFGTMRRADLLAYREATQAQSPGITEEDRCYSAGPVSDGGMDPRNEGELASSYLFPVHGRTNIDVYDVCDIFRVDDPSGATQHALKKLLCAGQRGYKSHIQDLREAVTSINRRIALLEAHERHTPPKGE